MPDIDVAEATAKVEALAARADKLAAKIKARANALPPLTHPCAPNVAAKRQTEMANAIGWPLVMLRQTQLDLADLDHAHPDAGTLSDKISTTVARWWAKCDPDAMRQLSAIAPPSSCRVL